MRSIEELAYISKNGIMAEPAPWPQGDPTTWDMNAILEETLECTLCDTTVTQEMMEADIAAGRVNLNIDPSFLVEPKEEPIGPFDDPEPKTHCPGYLNGASVDQIARYKNRTCTELEAYAMQRHLHFHRIGKQGFISLCRNFREIEDVRSWSFGLAYQDDLLHSEDEMDLDYGWPQTQEEKSMPDQEIVWFSGFEEREKRETQRRKKWRSILRKRQKQRAEAKKAEMSMDKHEVRRRRREADHRAQLYADWCEKKRQYAMIYYQYPDLLSDNEEPKEEPREKPREKPMKKGRRGKEAIKEARRKAGKKVR